MQLFENECVIFITKIIAVEARKSGKDVNVGYEMAYCHKHKKPMPSVIEIKTTDDIITQRVKRIVKNMTKFRSVERKHIAEVEEEMKGNISVVLQNEISCFAKKADKQKWNGCNRHSCVSIISTTFVL